MMSSKPSSTVTKKHCLEKKVFKFVLLDIGDPYKNDILSFSESTVALRGFI